MSGEIVIQSDVSETNFPFFDPFSCVVNKFKKYNLSHFFNNALYTDFFTRKCSIVIVVMFSSEKIPPILNMCFLGGRGTLLAFSYNCSSYRTRLMILICYLFVMDFSFLQLVHGCTKLDNNFTALSVT